MTWTYRIENGAVRHNGLHIGRGYSGHGDGRDNAKLVAVPNVGPIPPGRYRIGEAYQHPRLGPVVMNLDPMPGTETFGRSAFRIHGDSATGDASHGCIVAAPAIRRAFAASPDKILEVTE